MVEPIYALLFALLALVLLTVSKNFFTKHYDKLRQIIIDIDNKYIGIHDQSSEKMAEAVDMALDYFKGWRWIPNQITRPVLKFIIELALKKYKKECDKDGK